MAMMQGMQGDMSGFMGSDPKRRKITKTLVCRHFAKGYCQMGEACGFAHGDHELGASSNAPPNMASSVPAGAVLKTKICNYFAAGSCTRGPACNFAHGEHELGSPQNGAAAQFGNDTSGLDQLLQEFGADGGSGHMSQEDELLLQQLMSDTGAGGMGGGMGGMQSGGGQQQGKGGGKGFMKTKLCTLFESGHCPRAQCSFAHGQHEIGTPQGASAGNHSNGQKGQKPAQQPWAQQSAGWQDNSGWGQEDDYTQELNQLQTAMLQGTGHSGGPKVVSAMSSPWANKAGVQAIMANQGWQTSPQPDQGGKGGFKNAAPQSWQAQQAPQGGKGFKKTKVCTNHAGGYCARGESCTFAHGEEELGTLQGSSGAMQQQQWGQPQQQQQGSGFKKSKLCHHFAQSGTCGRGEACGFAHGEHELGTMQTGGGAGAGDFMQMGKGGKGGPTTAEKELFNFKTTPCNNWMNTGSCPRGERCSFAHGEGELMAPGQAKNVVEQMEQDGSMEAGGMDFTGVF